MVIPYLDDLLIHSRSVLEHLGSLATVLEAIAKGGLKLQPHKCQLVVAETSYLGHIVSQDGIRPLPSHTQIIKDWPIPKTRSQVRSFIGKVSYYRKFIKDFAKVAKPLLDRLATLEIEGQVLKDMEEFPVTKEMEHSFET